MRIFRSAGVMFAALLAGCGGGASPEGSGGAPPPMDVQVLELHAEPIAQQESLVGRLSAVRSAEVRARVAGILQQRVFEEGRDVAAGDLLFRIDPAPLAAEVKSQQAELALAQAESENAQARLQRAEGMRARALNSEQEVEDARAAARVAAAAVLRAQANLEKAGLDLSYAAVTAPIFGRVGKAQLTEGALVGEDDATWLTTIEQIDELLVDFTVSVASWQMLRAVQAASEPPPIRVRAPDGSLHAHPATLAFADQAVDPRTGTIALRAVLPNPERSLLPGMFVTLEVNVAQPQPAFRVPQSAVLRDEIGAFVFVLAPNDTVERRDVLTTGTVEGDWRVSSGLSQGERLIISRLQFLRPGASAKAAALVSEG